MFALPAADLSASLEFFESAIGLRRIADFPDEELPAADFDLGTTRLRIYTWTKDFKRAGHSGLLIAMPDLDAAVARVKSAGYPAGEIRREPWGAHVSTLVDPDGNLFDLIDLQYLSRLPPGKEA